MECEGDQVSSAKKEKQTNKTEARTGFDLVQTRAAEGANKRNKKIDRKKKTETMSILSGAGGIHCRQSASLPKIIRHLDTFHAIFRGFVYERARLWAKAKTSRSSTCTSRAL